MTLTTTDHFTGNKIQNYFTAYVEQALKNNRVSYYRKYKAHLKSELLFNSEEQLAVHTNLHTDISNDADSTHPLNPDSIHHTELAEELRNISNKDLTIIRLRIAYGYTYRMIGSILGMKEEAVRVRYFRVIQKIRDNMKGAQK